MRSQEHLEVLFEETTPGIMWGQYGVVGDILVCIPLCLLLCILLMSSFLKPFTYHFPWADIYELMSPDILHQLIKGTFKDHLVVWVEQYLEKVHGSRAQEFMDDIDKRCVALACLPLCIVILS